MKAAEIEAKTRGASPRSYFTDDVAFSLPDGFRDRTVQLLEWTTPTHEIISLDVSRELLPRRHPDEPLSRDDLERYFDAETRGHPTQFAGLRTERDEHGVTTGGVAFHRKAFRWKKGTEARYHHQVFALLGDRVMVLTGSASAELRGTVDVVIDRALKDLRRRKGA